MQGSYLLSFSVNTKICLTKFQQIIAEMFSLNFSHFTQGMFFPKNTFKIPGKKLGQFFMNKKVCISTKRKQANVINYQNGL